MAFPWRNYLFQPKHSKWVLEPYDGIFAWLEFILVEEETEEVEISVKEEETEPVDITEEVSEEETEDKEETDTVEEVEASTEKVAEVIEKMKRQKIRGMEVCIRCCN